VGGLCLRMSRGGCVLPTLAESDCEVGGSETQRYRLGEVDERVFLSFTSRALHLLRFSVATLQHDYCIWVLIAS
jgi:hypothetical protein